MKNKKIINATPVEYVNIVFRSKIEATIYKTLLQEGFKPEYETHTYIIWEGFKPTVPFYTRDKAKDTILNLRKLTNTRYTPDIYMEYEGLKIIIEVKGATNDVFPYKFKMFRKYIENLPDKGDYLILEVFSKKQLLELIPIIKSTAIRRKTLLKESFMKSIDRIRKLLVNLPKSDQPLGEQFVQSRDFESLKDLVESAIFRTRKGLKRDSPKQEYLDVDLTELSVLRAEVEAYLTQLEIPENKYEEENSEREDEYYGEEY